MLRISELASLSFPKITCVISLEFLTITSSGFRLRNIYIEREFLEFQNFGPKTCPDQNSDPKAGIYI